MARLPLALTVCATILLCGCTTLFFQPSSETYPFIFLERLRFRELRFPSLDGTELTAWHLESSDNRAAFPEFTHARGPTKGLIVQFHGNAQNMTSHYRGLAWVLFEGYDLLTFDYRGYGRSQGEGSLKGINEDARAAMRFASELAARRNLPLYFYGQSLGGTLLLRALEDQPPPPQLKLVVIESSFYSYQMIAREKLSSTWLTWPLQWLAYVLISDAYSPALPQLKRLPPIQTVLIYSEDDPIVPKNHGESFFAGIDGPKQLWLHPNQGHINSMWVEDGKYRKRFIQALQKATMPQQGAHREELPQ